MVEAILIQVSLESNTDPEYTAELARRLSEDLRELDGVQSVEPGSSPLPAGAKGLGIMLSALLVKIAQPGSLSAISGVLAAWVAADHGRKIKLTVNNNTLEVDNLSAAQQQDLIDWFKTQAAKPA